MGDSHIPATEYGATYMGTRCRCGSDQINQLALGVSVAVDVSRGHGQTAVTSKLLNIPQTAASLSNLAGR